MEKRFVKEYGNDIKKRKKDMENYSQIETEISRAIKVYNKGLITTTEIMKTLVSIDFNN